jgi:hypothetical protein
MMSLPTCLRAKSAADIQRMHPDAMHVEGWIEDGFGHAVSIQGRGTTVPARCVYNHVSAVPIA